MNNRQGDMVGTILLLILAALLIMAALSGKLDAWLSKLISFFQGVPAAVISKATKTPAEPSSNTGAKATATATATKTATVATGTKSVTEATKPKTKAAKKSTAPANPGKVLTPAQAGLAQYLAGEAGNIESSIESVINDIMGVPLPPILP